MICSFSFFKLVKMTILKNDFKVVNLRIDQPEIFIKYIQFKNWPTCTRIIQVDTFFKVNKLGNYLKWIIFKFVILKNDQLEIYIFSSWSIKKIEYDQLEKWFLTWKSLIDSWPTQTTTLNMSFKLMDICSRK